MADVAKRAGVSGQTVSRVSTGRTNVDEATRERVLAAMSELGYRPNAAARALRSGRFRSIGVITDQIREFGTARTLEGITSAAVDEGYTIVLMPIPASGSGDARAHLERLNEQAVDGIVIVIATDRLRESELELPNGVPIVWINSLPRDARTHANIDADQEAGARLATEHLLDLGHRTVFHVAGPAGDNAAAIREHLWARALTERGIEPPTTLHGDWSTESGYRAGVELAADPAVTAVFVANDQMALGVMRALHEAGRAIPGDVSVVGYDNMSEAAAFWPSLTTIHQSFDEVGRRAVSLLLEAIEGSEKPANDVVVPVELVVRESSGPAPRS